MGMRAVTTVNDNGRPRRFYAQWGSPEYQIPHLADFLTWADRTGAPLSTGSYHRYATDHPGTLPAEEVTDEFDDDSADDLNYRYHLTLAAETRSLRLVARDMRDAGRVVATVGRANLYATAAQMCDLLAERGQRYAHRNQGAVLPGGDPDHWRQAAAEYRRLSETAAVTAAAANLAAQHTPADHTDPYPSLMVAGIVTLTYLDDTATLCVSVHLDDAADWLVRPDDTVPIRVFIGDIEVYHA